MNKRIKKKKCKDCTSCKLFEGWDDFRGQYGEYGRCELEPYFMPMCKMNEQIEEVYGFCWDNFTEWLEENTGKKVCKFWKRK